MRAFAALGALALAAGPAQAEPDVAAPAERWFEIVGPSGQLVGIQQETETAMEGGREVRRVRRMAYRIDGHPVTRTLSVLVRSYDRDGRLAGFTREERSGRSWMILSGRRTGDRLEWSRDFNGRRSVHSAGGLAPDFAFADLEASERALGTQFRISASGAGLERVDRSLVFEETGDGGRRSLRVARNPSRLIDAQVALTAGDGSLREIRLPQIGYDLVLRPSPRPLREGELTDAQRLPHEMHPSEFYVGRDALAGHIRYRFGFRDGFATAIPETGEQAARWSDGALTVDICRECGPGLSSDPADLERWRRSSKWIESDAPEFGRIAQRASGRSERARMLFLAKAAREQISEIDFEGHVSARTAWRRGSGDCTEDAVVLAALARASGIAARVASGLVYSRSRYHGAANAFLPHSWVVAYVDGRWESFDISLEGFDASHIALSIGDGEPDSIIEAGRIAALLDWREMTEVRKRP